MSVNLSIKDVPQALAERLRQRAERHHRSLQGELMSIIERAAAPETESSGERALPANATSVTHQGWKTIEDLIADRRRRPLPATAGLPLAVDIIRSDRDSR